MAYNADIQLQVKGLRALDQLERKLDTVERAIDNINRRSIRLDSFRRASANIERLNRSLNTARGTLRDLNQTVQVRVDNSGIREAARQLDRLTTTRTVRLDGQASASQSPSSGGGGLSDGLGLATVAAAKTNNELGKLTQWLQDTERRTKGKSPFIKYLNLDKKSFSELDQLTKELDSTIFKRAGRVLDLDNEIDDLVKFKGAATEGTFAIDNQIRALDRERNSLIQSNRLDQERIASLEKRKKKLLDVAAAQDKANKARARGANFGRGVGAGLAFSNLPGSGFAQQIGAGALAGGKAGAIGAGIGAIGGAIAALAGPAAVATAELQKLEIALRGILGTRTEEALRVIDQAARDFNQPIADATRNFTQLSAAAVANGNSVEEIENLYRGLSAAVKGTGGNAEDLNGVLRAATQVISKGKVQAEELRGQIGDRLPGAFQLFAKATKRSTAELDKALQDGKVTANEFVTDFATFIRDKYEPAAKQIGDSPAEAGARLAKALEDLERSVGPIFQRLGSQFADFATEAIKELKRVFDFLGTVSDAIEEKLGSGVKNVGTLIRNRDIAQRSLERLLKEQAETPVSDLVKQEDLQFKINVQLQAIDNLEKRLRAIGAKDLPTPPKPKKPIQVGDEVDPSIGQRAAEEAFRLETELSRLLQQRLRNQAETVKLGQSKTEQILTEASVLKQIFDEQKKELERKFTGKRLTEEVKTLTTQIALETARLRQEWAGVVDEIEQVGRAAGALNTRVGDAVRPPESEFDSRLRENTRNFGSGQQEVEDLRKQFDKLVAGTSLDTAFEPIDLAKVEKARKELELAEQALKGLDPRKLTSLQVTEGTREELESQIRLLQQGGRELSTLDELVIQYGADWEKLDPTVKGQLVELARTKDALTAINNEAAKLDEIYAGVGQTIETGIIDAVTRGIDALVSGTEDLDTALKEIASGVLRDISQQLLSAAVSLGLRSLGGNDGIGFFSKLFPQRAEGGPVSPDKTFLVGEKGPELFVPKVAGEIISNKALKKFAEGGRPPIGDVSLVGERGPELFLPDTAEAGDTKAAFTEAAGALRSSDSVAPAEGEEASEAFSQAAAALARSTTTIISNSQTSNQALMAESMQASMSASKEMNIRFDSRVINSVEYVTAEQFREGVAESAKQARAQVFKDLKNKPSVRRSVGMG